MNIILAAQLLQLPHQLWRLLSVALAQLVLQSVAVESLAVPMNPAFLCISLPLSITPSSSLSLHSVCKFYGEDLPNSASLESELQLWQSKWRAEHNLASTLNTPEKALVHADKDFYPNIHTLLSIMATLPVTSCECERSISMLRIVKSQLRSSMGQNRLNNLALLYYHYDIEIT